MCEIFFFCETWFNCVYVYQECVLPGRQLPLPFSAVPRGKRCWKEQQNTHLKQIQAKDFYVQRYQTILGWCRNFQKNFRKCRKKCLSDVQWKVRLDPLGRCENSQVSTKSVVFSKNEPSWSLMIEPNSRCLSDFCCCHKKSLRNTGNQESLSLWIRQLSSGRAIWNKTLMSLFFWGNPRSIFAIHGC